MKRKEGLHGVSLKVKVTLIIAVSLLLTIAAVLYITARSQTGNLRGMSERTLAATTAMLNVAIRNIMLNGEAPIVVGTLEDMQGIPEIQRLELYRTDGTVAFHDYQTLETVNKNLGMQAFERTERRPFSRIDNQHFRDVLSSNSPRRVDLERGREIEYYFPVLNLPDCRRCHGGDHLIRGVSRFTISNQDVFEQIKQANLLLIGVFALAGTGFGLVLHVFLQRVVVHPLLTIGSAVRRVAGGDFETRVSIARRDEVGELGDEINRMIKGLEERFKLSKYVSRSTENLIRQQETGDGDGDRRRVTVLFSDIRRFTSFAEGHSPGDVVRTLNRILQGQAEEVERHNGDIDKFIGDAVMALFEDEYSAVLCAYRMIQRVKRANEEMGTDLGIGIGINAGEIILGHIGSENRQEYAAIGDTVNVASRLSGLARRNMILISESVMRAVEGRVIGKLIPDQAIKGKTSRINFYVVKAVSDRETARWLR
ncbi:MAG: adenylate/guanylate cyclase domain-containing protein [Spirochaetota bacterium]